MLEEMSAISLHAIVSGFSFSPNHGKPAQAPETETKPSTENYLSFIYFSAEI